MPATSAVAPAETMRAAFAVVTPPSTSRMMSLPLAAMRWRIASTTVSPKVSGASEGSTTAVACRYKSTSCACGGGVLAGTPGTPPTGPAAARVALRSLSLRTTPSFS